jgi:hypothetical protein
MEHDEAKIDEMVLALLYLTMFHNGVEIRSWKGHDWSAMGRLYKNGYISDPRNKAHSVRMTDVGAKRAKELFEKNFLRSFSLRLPEVAGNLVLREWPQLVT